MALTREAARIREVHELRRYLRDLRLDRAGTRIPTEIADEALDLWAETQHASVDNILWSTLRQVAGDPGPLRAKIEVRARRNTGVSHLDWHKIRYALDEALPAGLDHTAKVERLLGFIQGVVNGSDD